MGDAKPRGGVGGVAMGVCGSRASLKHLRRELTRAVLQRTGETAGRRRLGGETMGS